MIRALVLGIVLAFMNTSALAATAIIVVATVLLVTQEVTTGKTLLGSESPYVSYVRSLRQSGDHRARPWVSFGLMAFATFLPSGLVALV